MDGKAGMACSVAASWPSARDNASRPPRIILERTTRDEVHDRDARRRIGIVNRGRDARLGRRLHAGIRAQRIADVVAHRGVQAQQIRTATDLDTIDRCRRACLDLRRDRDGSGRRPERRAQRHLRGVTTIGRNAVEDQQPIFLASSMIVSPTASQLPSALKSRVCLGPCSYGRLM